MKKFLIMTVLTILSFCAQAQLSDQERIVGTWRLDSFNIIDLSTEDVQMMEEVKSVMFLTFDIDSTVTLPDFESDFDEESLPTVVSLYYLKEGKLHIIRDDDVMDYEFLSENYIELKQDEESMFFRKEQ